MNPTPTTSAVTPTRNPEPGTRNAERRTRNLLFILLAATAGLLLVACGCGSRADRLAAPNEADHAVAEVLAEAVTAVGGAGAKVAVLTEARPVSATPDPLATAFTAAARAAGLDVIATEAVSGETGELGTETGLDFPAFLGCVQRHADAQVLLLLCGAPARPAGPTPALPATHPRLVVYSPSDAQPPWLYAEGLAAAAVVARAGARLGPVQPDRQQLKDLLQVLKR